MRRIALLLALVIFLVDQASKWLIVERLQLAEVGQIVLLPVFNLTWVENHGVSLGMLTADSATERWLLVALTAAIAAGVLLWLWREVNRADALALGAILGGALGNIVDRSRYGYVVDFMDLHFGEIRPFLVFNLADAAITLGVIVLLLRAFVARPSKEVVDA